MKKLFYLLLIISPLLVTAQEDRESSFGITGGYSPNGIAFHASYNYSLNPKAYLQAAAYLNIAEVQENNIDIPYNIVTINAGYFYNLTPNLSRFKGSLGIGGLIGYEDINSGNNELITGAIIDGESKLIYGLFVGAEGYYQLTDLISLLGVVNEYYHINSDLGNATLYVGLGLKFHFY